MGLYQGHINVRHEGIRVCALNNNYPDVLTALHPFEKPIQLLNERHIHEVERRMVYCGEGHSPVDIDFEPTVILTSHLVLLLGCEFPASVHLCPPFGLHVATPYLYAFRYRTAFSPAIRPELRAKLLPIPEAIRS
jgi:hypothetical protein